MKVLESLLADKRKAVRALLGSKGFAGVSDQVSTCGRLSSLANLGRGGLGGATKKKRRKGKNNKKENDRKGSTNKKKDYEYSTTTGVWWGASFGLVAGAWAGMCTARG